MNTGNIEEIVESVVEEAVESLSAMDNVMSFIIVAVLAIIAIFILTKPLRFVIKMAINTVVGFISLMAVNYAGAYIGVTVAINWVNGIIVALFGVPGVCVLFAIEWFSLI